jgi:hypothetical protein
MAGIKKALIFPKTYKISGKKLDHKVKCIMGCGK